MRHIELPGSFPDPTPEDMAVSLATLGEVPEGMPPILDGFLSGTLDTDGLARLRAPLCAVVHHPLGLESGLGRERASFLIGRERANLGLVGHILVPSVHTAETLVADFGVAQAKVTVAPPGFDAATAPRRPADPPLILSVGILHPRKGHDVLLDALAQVADLDWQAAIAGGAYDATHADALRVRAAAAELTGRVRILGEGG